MWPFQAALKTTGEEVVFRTLVSDELLHVPDPPRESDVLQEVSAEQAAEKLHAGHPLVGLRVKGRPDSRQQDLDVPFEAELEGRKVIVAGLPGPPAVTRPAFRQAIDIRGCLFEGWVVLSGMHYKESVAATSTTFLNGIDAQYSTFERGVQLFRCRLDERAMFSDATFWDTARFAHVIFERADFYNALFQKDAVFSESLFREVSNFSQGRFLKPAPHVCLDFHMSKCLEAAYFKDARMEGIADFTGANFREQADFLGTSFRLVNVTHAKFGRLDLKWEQLEGGRLLFGEIVLPDFENKPAIEEHEWTRLLTQRKDAELPDKHRQYDVLRAIFISQGDHVSSDGCFYEWKQVERRQTRIGWNPESWMVKAFHVLNWISCGYGVKPIRTVAFAVMLVALFAIAYALLDPAFIAAASAADHTLQLIFSKLDFSASAFMNFDADSSGLVPAARMLFLIERLLGWLTLLLFVTTYTRLMLR